MKLRIRLILLALILVTSVASGGDGSRARQPSCVAGPSLLLVQTPKADDEVSGYEAGLRVVDVCGADIGVIDVPNPVFVVPTARSGVALVHTAGGPGVDTPGHSYLVDARSLTARKLALPLESPTTFAAGTLLISPASTDHYAVVATNDVVEGGSAGDRFDRLFVVDLRTAATVDIRPLIPAFTTVGTESGWVDDRTDTFYLDRGRQLVSVPLAHPEDAGRRQYGSLRSSPDYGGDRCASVFGDQGQTSLHLCVTSDGSHVEWRARRLARDPLRELPELADRSVLVGLWISSSGWIASPPALSVVRPLLSSVVEVDRVVFVDEMWDSYNPFRPEVRNLSEMSFLDLDSLKVSTITGLPDGRHLAMLIEPAGAGDKALLSVASIDGDYDRTTDELWLAGDLYLIDFVRARATLLGSNIGGVLSPHGVAIAVTDLVGPVRVPALSVGLVGGPLVGVGPGFGTWLTP